MSSKENISTKQRFLQAFPPPLFLDIPAVGVNISDHSIKLMQIRRSERDEIVLFGEEEIGDGIIVNGNINNRTALADILKRVQNKYKLKFIRASIPEEKAYVFKTRVVKSSKRSELRSRIEFELESNVPLSSQEAIFDFEIIPGSEKTKTLALSVSVLPQKIIASYLGLFQEAGMVPLSFEIEAETIARSVIRENDPGTYMIVDYGRSRTGISVVEAGVLRYTSTAEVGGDMMTDILKKRFKMNDKEATAFKNEVGLELDDKKGEQSMSLVSPVSVLKDEINKRFIYWHTHEDEEGKVGSKIQKIILVGGNSNLKGLTGYLSNTLKISVERANVWNNLNFREDFIPSVDFNHSLGFASAVGLSLVSFSSND